MGVKRIVCAVLVCLLLCGCKGQTSVQETVFAMDTVMDLKIWAENETAARDAAQRVHTLIDTLAKTWSATDVASKLSIFNAGGDPGFTAEENGLLARIDALSLRTEGCFDPRLQSLIEAWGFYDQNYRLPSDEQLTQALADSKMDLGAAIKGYAGQQAALLLQDMDVDRALLNLGGNIQTVGEKPDGSPWVIGIQDPSGGGSVGTVSVTGTASVVTSGSYQRYFEENGVRYHHILDPETGRPADSGLASVTVICRDGLTADVLSTALFVMGLERGVELWRQSDDFEVVFILESGAIYATEQAALADCEYEVIRREK